MPSLNPTPESTSCIKCGQKFVNLGSEQTCFDCLEAFSNYEPSVVVQSPDGSKNIYPCSKVSIVRDKYNFWKKYVIRDGDNIIHVPGEYVQLMTPNGVMG